MDSNSFSLVSRAKRGAQPISPSKDDRMGRVLSSQDAVSLQELKASAFRCRTPKQFRTLLNSLQTILPYQNLFCGWGYPASSAAIGFFYNHRTIPASLRAGISRKACLGRVRCFTNGYGKQNP